MYSLLHNSDDVFESKYVCRDTNVIQGAGVEFTTDASTGLISRSVLDSLMDKETSEDLRRFQSSSHCIIYASLCSRFCELDDRFTIDELRLVLQLLLFNSRAQTIVFKGGAIGLGLEFCRACGKSGGTLEHLLYDCAVFQMDRLLCGLPRGTPSLPFSARRRPGGSCKNSQIP